MTEERNRQATKGRKPIPIKYTHWEIRDGCAVIYFGDSPLEKIDLDRLIEVWIKKNPKYKKY